MTRFLVIGACVALLSGCVVSMTREQVIAAIQECHAAGLGVRLMETDLGDIRDVQCVPSKPTTGATHES